MKLYKIAKHNPYDYIMSCLALFGVLGTLPYMQYAKGIDWADIIRVITGSALIGLLILAIPVLLYLAAVRG